MGYIKLAQASVQDLASLVEDRPHAVNATAIRGTDQPMLQLTKKNMDVHC